MKEAVTVSALREKSNTELMSRSVELQRQVFEVRNNLATGGEKSLAKEIPVKKRERARILTILRERELQQDSREPLL